MRLQDFTSTDVYGGATGVSTGVHSLSDGGVRFSSAGTNVAVGLNSITKSARFTRPEVHIRTDQITMDNLE